MLSLRAMPERKHFLREGFPNTDNFACVLYLWPDHFLHLLVLYVWSHVGAHLHWAAPWRLLLPTRGKAVPRHEMDGEENHSEILPHIKCG